MFTGIIEEIGRVTAAEPSGDGLRLTIEAPRSVDGAHHGDSIAISGVCLTVVDQTPTGFTADVMKQTLDMSSLAGLGVGTAVNVEPALASGGRLGGHIVQGHVDGVGEILEVRPGDEWQVVRVGIPSDLAPLVVDKGSITLDGISLTISDISAAGDAAPWLEVSLIPETLRATTLGERGVGDRLNLETDIIARHVQRLAAFAQLTPEEGTTR
ncbi:riboflavin synthase [Microbacterium indicum]|uniref:riboflavin synthase n=1 Tax=Microbacterium indicum TaxID=358100 RepID=UPI000400F5A7|nr:riboflavin synthase [Microbacterium indicum]